jgi:hypothetical protein
MEPISSARSILLVRICARHHDLHSFDAIGSDKCAHLNMDSFLYGEARAPRSVRFGAIAEVKLGQSLMGDQKFYYLELLRASEGTLSCWS